MTVIFILLFSVWAAYFGYRCGYLQGRRDAEGELAVIQAIATAAKRPSLPVDLMLDAEGEAMEPRR
jgi:hypothetical protein